MVLRKATDDDLPHLRRVFRLAVLAVDLKNYTVGGLIDWASCGDNEARWRDKIEKQAFFVAQNEESQIIGLGSITQQGLLDLLYVDPSVQGCGVGAELLDCVEHQAKINGCRSITSEVSLPALSFFLHRGYRVEREQQRVAHTVALTNFLVHKQI